MRILYGIENNYRDVTNICLSKLISNNIITIPYGDGIRATYFGDHLVGKQKKVIVILNNNITQYEHFFTVNINVETNIITKNANGISSKLSELHTKLNIRHGFLEEEVPEQEMVVKYLNGDEKVLEIGGNIGRNSLIISSILKDSSNLVTLETDESISRQLSENRDLNNLKFHIENSALSKRKLIQKGWDTIPSDTLINGFKWVNTISMDELRLKYNINFDTLVLDCEGAFYYILMDMPEILENINLIIMENDYRNIHHKIYIDEILKQHYFERDYVEGGGWGPCEDNFFEVWKKIDL